jgi:hypothetical protein
MTCKKEWFIKVEIPIDYMFDPIDEVTLRQILKHYNLTKNKCKYVMAKFDVEDAKWFGVPKGGILGINLLFDDEQHYMVTLLKMTGRVREHGFIDN